MGLEDLLDTYSILFNVETIVEERQNYGFGVDYGSCHFKANSIPIVFSWGAEKIVYFLYIVVATMGKDGEHFRNDLSWNVTVVPVQ